MKHVFIILLITLSITACRMGKDTEPTGVNPDAQKQESTEEPLVGGGCSYDHYNGTCTVTDIPNDGWPHFRYEGDSKNGNKTVEGNELVLQVIASDPSGTQIDRSNEAITNSLEIKVDNKYNCTLTCIKTGTCTPAGIEIDGLQNEYYSAHGQTSGSELCY